MSHADALLAYTGAFVDALARSGVEHAVICPGSRSTPLAILLDRHPGIRTWLHLDERSAGFFALGMAKAKRRPVAVLATSGTATANFAPAVVEAFHGRTPLLVITADRPPELRDVGALQTIDQQRLYGNHVNWYAELLIPEIGVAAGRHARAVAARAVARTLGDKPGPVHLNAPFREPLVPASGPLPHGEKVPIVRQGERRLGRSDLEELAFELAGFERGLIVCGPQDDSAFPTATLRLASALGWPVLADVLSGVRCNPETSPAVLGAFDSYLRDQAIVSALAPDCLLRFGATPVSKPLQAFIERHTTARQILVDGGGGWADQAQVASDVVWADPTALCLGLAEVIQQPHGASAWLGAWQNIERRSSSVLATALATIDELTEPGVFADLAAILPDGSTLFVGSSMPVRDCDSFIPVSGRAVRFVSNRGASGIDGLVSTGLGLAAADDGPVVIAVGDISFFHDLNGLLAAKLHQLSATVVLIDNDGGGIFSFLPQADQVDRFEALFGTPHGLDFAPAAALFGLRYCIASNRQDLRTAVEQSLGGPGVTVVHVRTERSANAELHRTLFAGVAASLRAEPVRT
ncbi:MAG: 2-succinyl-5-enolpyruvyl-6-hydroxy-3-cyclohexene-1-carboxylic-acid synthase [Dehalococcoidia bacterium]